MTQSSLLKLIMDSNHDNFIPFSEIKLSGKDMMIHYRKEQIAYKTF